MTFYILKKRLTDNKRHEKRSIEMVYLSAMHNYYKQTPQPTDKWRLVPRSCNHWATPEYIKLDGYRGNQMSKPMINQCSLQPLYYSIKVYCATTRPNQCLYCDIRLNRFIDGVWFSNSNAAMVNPFICSIAVFIKLSGYQVFIEIL